MDIWRLPASLRSLAAIQRWPLQLALRSWSSASRQSTSNHTGQSRLTASAVSPALLTLDSNTLNDYTASYPPTKTQLKYANATFMSGKYRPQLLFTTAYFRYFPPYSHPEVAFLGRSNVGKSSLLNALFNRTNDTVAHVSKRPGRTRTMNGFSVGASLGYAKGGEFGEGDRPARWKRLETGGCVVVDMPGYGAGSQDEWGKEAIKYLENRKQLRRTFLLVDAEHGLKSTDKRLLLYLKKAGLPHQIILSKTDKLLFPRSKAPSATTLSNSLLKLRERCHDIRKELDDAVAEAGAHSAAIGDILCCSAEKSLDSGPTRGKLGINELRWAILSACGLECDEHGRKRQVEIEIARD